MRKLLLALALTTPVSLVAQTGTTLSSYVAADDGVSGGPVLLGATLTREVSWVALRAGVAVDARSTPLASRTESEGTGAPGVFSADVDGLLYLGNPAGDGPVVPYALAGLGGRLVRGASDASTALTWSYGGGVRTPLSPRLSIEGEARYRQPLGEGVVDIPTELSAGWEFRFGLNLRVSRLAAPRARSAPTPLRRPASTPAGVEAGAVSAAEMRLRVAERALDTADDYLGTRYKWGGNTPEEGFDCSGFIRWVYARQGISLPRVSREQAQVGSALPLELGALEPGDLIAFASDGVNVSHIAIYAGNGRIIHSSSSGGGVRFDDLHSRRGQWYRTHMVAARRVIEGPWLWSVR